MVGRALFHCFDKASWVVHVDLIEELSAFLRTTIYIEIYNYLILQSVEPPGYVLILTDMG